jgi:hypothetical protein
VISKTYDCLESPDLFFLGDHASSSTSSATDRVVGVFTAHDTFHDFTEKSNALSISNDGTIWVVVGRIELDGFTGEFESLCEGSARGRSRTFRGWLRVPGGKYETI